MNDNKRHYPTQTPGHGMAGMLDGVIIEPCNAYTTDTLAHLYDYWVGLQETYGRKHIRWSDVDLMDLYKIAPNLMVKDIIDNGVEFQNRYWGTKLREFFGMDATGAMVADYYEGEHLEQVLTALRFFMEDNRAVRVAGKSRFFITREHVSVEACYIPLYDAQNVPSHLLVVFEFESLD